jgi:hypothetical protein
LFLRLRRTASASAPIVLHLRPARSILSACSASTSPPPAVAYIYRHVSSLFMHHFLSDRSHPAAAQVPPACTSNNGFTPRPVRIYRRDPCSHNCPTLTSMFSTCSIISSHSPRWR